MKPQICHIKLILFPKYVGNFGKRKAKRGAGGEVNRVAGVSSGSEEHGGGRYQRAADPCPSACPSVDVHACVRVAALADVHDADVVDDGFDDGADEHRFQYAEGTAPAICEAEIRSIECSHCKLRLGITDKRAVNARCALCGKVTNIAEAREKQKLVPAKLPRVDVVAQCRACKAYVGVPKKVATFQCASCGQVNVAGAIRA